MPAYNLTMNVQLQVTNLPQTVGQINNALRGVGTGALGGVAAQARQAAAASQQVARGFSRAAQAAASAQAATRGYAASSANAAAQLRQTAAAAQQAGSAMDQFGSLTGLAARRFLAFNIGAGTITSLSLALRSGVSDAVQFEREMVRLNQVSNETPAALRQVQTELTRVARATGASSLELARGATVFAQAGIRAEETAKLLQTLADASLAPNFDSMAETAEGMVAVFQQFRPSAAGVREGISSMNAVASEFAVEGRDLIEVVKRAGGAFKASGGDLNELLGLFTSIRATTRESADAIGTGLRTILTRFQRQETVDALQDLQINLRYTREEAESLGDLGLTNQFVGAYEAVRRLSEGLATLRTSDPRYFQVLETLGGYRQISRTIPLIQQFPVSQRALSVAQAAGSSLTTSTEKAQDALLTKTERLRETYAELFRNILESRGFRSAVEGALELAQAMKTVFDVVKPLVPLLTTLATIQLARGIAGFFSNVSGSFTGSALASPVQTVRRAQGGPILRMSRGGVVPGHGLGDHVPALLEPDEFVVNRRAARDVGHDALRRLNAGLLPARDSRGRQAASQRMAGGGPVSPQVARENLRAHFSGNLREAEKALEQLGIGPILSPFLTGLAPSAVVRPGYDWVASSGISALRGSGVPVHALSDRPVETAIQFAIDEFTRRLVEGRMGPEFEGLTREFEDGLGSALGYDPGNADGRMSYLASVLGVGVRGLARRPLRLFGHRDDLPASAARPFGYLMDAVLDLPRRADPLPEGTPNAYRKFLTERGHTPLAYRAVNGQLRKRRANIEGFARGGPVSVTNLARDNVRALDALLESHGAPPFLGKSVSGFLAHAHSPSQNIYVGPEFPSIPLGPWLDYGPDGTVVGLSGQGDGRLPLSVAIDEFLQSTLSGDKRLRPTLPGILGQMASQARALGDDQAPLPDNHWQHTSVLRRLFKNQLVSAHPGLAPHLGLEFEPLLPAHTSFEDFDFGVLMDALQDAPARDKRLTSTRVSLIRSRMSPGLGFRANQGGPFALGPFVPPHLRRLSLHESGRLRVSPSELEGFARGGRVSQSEYARENLSALNGLLEHHGSPAILDRLFSGAVVANVPVSGLGHVVSVGTRGPMSPGITVDDDGVVVGAAERSSHPTVGLPLLVALDQAARELTTDGVPRHVRQLVGFIRGQMRPGQPDGEQAAFANERHGLLAFRHAFVSQFARNPSLDPHLQGLDAMYRLGAQEPVEYSMSEGPSSMGVLLDALYDLPTRPRRMPRGASRQLREEFATRLDAARSLAASLQMTPADTQAYLARETPALRDLRLTSDGRLRLSPAKVRGFAQGGAAFLVDGFPVPFTREPTDEQVRLARLAYRKSEPFHAALDLMFEKAGLPSPGSREVSPIALSVPNWILPELPGVYYRGAGATLVNESVPEGLDTLVHEALGHGTDAYAGYRQTRDLKAWASLIPGHAHALLAERARQAGALSPKRVEWYQTLAEKEPWVLPAEYFATSVELGGILANKTLGLGPTSQVSEGRLNRAPGLAASVLSDVFPTLGAVNSGVARPVDPRAVEYLAAQINASDGRTASESLRKLVRAQGFSTGGEAGRRFDQLYAQLGAVPPDPSQFYRTGNADLPFSTEDMLALAGVLPGWTGEVDLQHGQADVRAVGDSGHLSRRLFHNRVYNTKIRANDPRSGVGGSVYLRQLAAARRLGVPLLEMHGAGSFSTYDEANGYHVWPTSFGADGNLAPELLRNAERTLGLGRYAWPAGSGAPGRLVPELVVNAGRTLGLPPIPPGISAALDRGHVKTIQQLLALPGGEQVWKHYGHTAQMRIDPSDDRVLALAANRVERILAGERQFFAGGGKADRSTYARNNLRVLDDLLQRHGAQPLLGGVFGGLLVGDVDPGVPSKDFLSFPATTFSAEPHVLASDAAFGFAEGYRRTWAMPLTATLSRLAARVYSEPMSRDMGNLVSHLKAQIQPITDVYQDHDNNFSFVQSPQNEVRAFQHAFVRELANRHEGLRPHLVDNDWVNGPRNLPSWVRSYYTAPSVGTAVGDAVAYPQSTQPFDLDQEFSELFDMLGEAPGRQVRLDRASSKALTERFPKRPKDDPEWSSPSLQDLWLGDDGRLRMAPANVKGFAKGGRVSFTDLAWQNLRAIDRALEQAGVPPVVGKFYPGALVSNMPQVGGGDLMTIFDGWPVMGQALSRLARDLPEIAAHLGPDAEGLVSEVNEAHPGMFRPRAFVQHFRRLYPQVVGIDAEGDELENVATSTGPSGVFEALIDLMSDAPPSRRPLPRNRVADFRRQLGVQQRMAFFGAENLGLRRLVARDGALTSHPVAVQGFAAGGAAFDYLYRQLGAAPADPSRFRSVGLNGTGYSERELLELAGVLPNWSGELEFHDRDAEVFAANDDETALSSRRIGGSLVENAGLWAPGHGGVGGSVYLRQLAAARRLGVGEIRLHAAGDPDNKLYNGYYVWPSRFGADGPVDTAKLYRRAALSDARRPRPTPEVLEALSAGSVGTVQQLLALPGGDEFWKHHGNDIDLTIRPDDPRVLDLAARRVERILAGERKFFAGGGQVSLSQYLRGNVRELDRLLEQNGVPPVFGGMLRGFYYTRHPAFLGELQSPNLAGTSLLATDPGEWREVRSNQRHPLVASLAGLAYAVSELPEEHPVSMLAVGLEVSRSPSTVREYLTSAFRDLATDSPQLPNLRQSLMQTPGFRRRHGQAGSTLALLPGAESRGTAEALSRPSPAQRHFPLLDMLAEMPENADSLDHELPQFFANLRQPLYSMRAVRGQMRLRRANVHLPDPQGFAGGGGVREERFDALFSRLGAASVDPSRFRFVGGNTTRFSERELLELAGVLPHWTGEVEFSGRKANISAADGAGSIANRDVYDSEGSNSLVNNVALFTPGGGGVGGSVYLRQLAAARKLGVEKIKMHATGNIDSPRTNGYYVWPSKFGADGPIRADLLYDMGVMPKAYRQAELPPAAPAVLEALASGTVGTVQQLLAVPGGDDFWKHYGYGVDLTIRPDDPRVLDLAARRVERMLAGERKFFARGGRVSFRAYTHDNLVALNRALEAAGGPDILARHLPGVVALGQDASGYRRSMTLPTVIANMALPEAVEALGRHLLQPQVYSRDPALRGLVEELGPSGLGRTMRAQLARLYPSAATAVAGNLSETALSQLTADGRSGAYEALFNLLQERRLRPRTFPTRAGNETRWLMSLPRYEDDQLDLATPDPEVGPAGLQALTFDREAGVLRSRPARVRGFAGGGHAFDDLYRRLGAAPANPDSFKFYGENRTGLSEQDLLDLAGVLPGWRGAVNFPNNSGRVVSVSARDGYGTFAERDVVPGLRPVVENINLSTARKEDGVGGSAYLRQLAAARRLGVDEIRLHAAGDIESDKYNGYYVWPSRFGADGPVNTDKLYDMAVRPEVYRSRPVPRPTPEVLEALATGSAGTVQQLLALPGGDEFWKHYGKDIDLTIRPGDPRVLDLAARRVERILAGERKFFSDGGVSRADREVRRRERLAARPPRDTGEPKLAAGGVVTAKNIRAILAEFGDVSGVDFSKMVRSIKVGRYVDEKKGDDSSGRFVGKRNDTEALFRTASDNDRDRRGTILLSSRNIRTMQQLRAALAHELGHAADRYLGGGHEWASHRAGTTAHRYGLSRSVADLALDGGGVGGELLTREGREYWNYYYENSEGFARTFEHALAGESHGLDWLVNRGFRRNVFGELAARTKPGGRGPQLGLFGRAARRPGLLGWAARLLGFAGGGRAEMSREELVQRQARLVAARRAPTPEEARALQDYIGAYYRDFSLHAATGSAPDSLVSDLPGKVSRLASWASQPLPEDLTLYHGYGEELLAAIRKQLGVRVPLHHPSLVGREFVAPGFVSTSTSRLISEGFATRGLFRIDSLAGARGVALDNEAEVLLPPGERFAIAGSEDRVVSLRRFARGGAVSRFTHASDNLRALDDLLEYHGAPPILGHLFSGALVANHNLRPGRSRAPFGFANIVTPMQLEVEDGIIVGPGPDTQTSRRTLVGLPLSVSLNQAAERLMSDGMPPHIRGMVGYLRSQIYPMELPTAPGYFNPLHGDEWEPPTFYHHPWAERMAFRHAFVGGLARRYEGLHPHVADNDRINSDSYFHPERVTNWRVRYSTPENFHEFDEFGQLLDAIQDLPSPRRKFSRRESSELSAEARRLRSGLLEHAGSLGLTEGALLNEFIAANALELRSLRLTADGRLNMTRANVRGFARGGPVSLTQLSRDNLRALDGLLEHHGAPPLLGRLSPGVFVTSQGFAPFLPYDSSELSEDLEFGPGNEIVGLRDGVGGPPPLGMVLADRLARTLVSSKVKTTAARMGRAMEAGVTLFDGRTGEEFGGPDWYKAYGVTHAALTHLGERYPGLNEHLRTDRLSTAYATILPAIQRRADWQGPFLPWEPSPGLLYESELTGQDFSELFDAIMDGPDARQNVTRSRADAFRRSLEAARQHNPETRVERLSLHPAGLLRVSPAGLQGFADGGQAFAQGGPAGVVPGKGNTDSVPVDLPVGSYVIRKSSALAIGHGTLARMAQRGPRMADGGVVPAMVMPEEFIFSPDQAARIGMANLEFMNKTGRLPFAAGGRAGFSTGDRVTQTTFGAVQSQGDAAVLAAVQQAAAAAQVALGPLVPVLLRLSEAGQVLSVTFGRAEQQSRKLSAAERLRAAQQAKGLQTRVAPAEAGYTYGATPLEADVRGPVPPPNVTGRERVAVSAAMALAAGRAADVGGVVPVPLPGIPALPSPRQASLLAMAARAAAASAVASTAPSSAQQERDLELAQRQAVERSEEYRRLAASERTGQVQLDESQSRGVVGDLTPQQLAAARTNAARYLAPGSEGRRLVDRYVATSRFKIGSGLGAEFDDLAQKAELMAAADFDPSSDDPQAFARMVQSKLAAEVTDARRKRAAVATQAPDAEAVRSAARVGRTDTGEAKQSDAPSELSSHLEASYQQAAEERRALGEVLGPSSASARAATVAGAEARHRQRSAAEERRREVLERETRRLGKPPSNRNLLIAQIQEYDPEYGRTKSARRSEADNLALLEQLERRAADRASAEARGEQYVEPAAPPQASVRAGGGRKTAASLARERDLRRLERAGVRVGDGEPVGDAFVGRLAASADATPDIINRLLASGVPTTVTASTRRADFDRQRAAQVSGRLGGLLAKAGYRDAERGLAADFQEKTGAEFAPAFARYTRGAAARAELPPQVLAYFDSLVRLLERNRNALLALAKGSSDAVQLEAVRPVDPSVAKQRAVEAARREAAGLAPGEALPGSRTPPSSTRRTGGGGGGGGRVPPKAPPAGSPEDDYQREQLRRQARLEGRYAREKLQLGLTGYEASTPEADRQALLLRDAQRGVLLVPGGPRYADETLVAAAARRSDPQGRREQLEASRYAEDARLRALATFAPGYRRPGPEPGAPPFVEATLSQLPRILTEQTGKTVGPRDAAFTNLRDRIAAAAKSAGLLDEVMSQTATVLLQFKNGAAQVKGFLLSDGAKQERASREDVGKRADELGRYAALVATRRQGEIENRNASVTGRLAFLPNGNPQPLTDGQQERYRRDFLEMRREAASLYAPVLALPGSRRARDLAATYGRHGLPVPGPVFHQAVMDDHGRHTAQALRDRWTPGFEGPPQPLEEASRLDVVERSDLQAVLPLRVRRALGTVGRTTTAEERRADRARRDAGGGGLTTGEASQRLAGVRRDSATSVDGRLDAATQAESRRVRDARARVEAMERQGARERDLAAQNVKTQEERLDRLRKAQRRLDREAATELAPLQAEVSRLSDERVPHDNEIAALEAARARYEPRRARMAELVSSQERAVEAARQREQRQVAQEPRRARALERARAEQQAAEKALAASRSRAGQELAAQTGVDVQPTASPERTANRALQRQVGAASDPLAVKAAALAAIRGGNTDPEVLRSAQQRLVQLAASGRVSERTAAAISAQLATAYRQQGGRLTDEEARGLGDVQASARRRSRGLAEEYQREVSAGQAEQLPFQDPASGRAYGPSRLPHPLGGRAAGTDRPLQQVGASVAFLSRTRLEERGGKVVEVANEGRTLAEQRAAARIERRLGPDAARGLVSEKTRRETQERETAVEQKKVEQELLAAQRRLLRAIYTRASQYEINQRAAEDVERARRGEVGVAVGRDGRVLGTKDVVDVATAQGVEAPGISRLDRVYSAVGGFLGAIPRAVGGAIRSIERSAFGRAFNGFDRLAFPASFVAPYLAEGIRSFGNTAENAVASERRFGYSLAQTTAGGVQGAVVGATVGSAIPGLGTGVGAAVGALAGAIAGVVTSIRQAEQDLRQVEIGNALKALSDKFQSLANVQFDANNVANVGPDTFRAAQKSLDQFERKTLEESRYNATFLLGGFDPKAFSAIEQKALRNDLSSQLPQMLQAIERLAQNEIRLRPGASSDEIFRSVTEANEGLGRRTLRIAARIREVPVDTVEFETKRNIEGLKRAFRIEQQELAGRGQLERSASTFGRLLLSVQAAADSLSLLQAQAQGLAEAFDGVVGPSRVSSSPDLLSQLGRPDGQARKPLRVLAAAGGEQGRALSDAGLALDQVAAALPSVVAQVAPRVLDPKDADQDFITQVQDNLRRQFAGQLKGNPQLEVAIGQVVRGFNSLSSEKGGRGIFEEIEKGDVSALVERVLKPLTEEVARSGGGALKLLDERANAFLVGLAQNSQRQLASGETRFRADQAGVTALRARAEADAGPFGRLTAVERLDISDLQASERRLAELSGGRALPPEELGRRLADAQRRIPGLQADQQRAYERTGGVGAEFVALARQLNATQTEAARYRQALQLMSDASLRNAAIQERLNSIQQDRSSRLYFGERFLSSDAEGRGRINRGLSLVARANQAGSLDGLLPDQQALVLETLRSLGQSRLTGLDGAPRADALMGRLVTGTAGGVFDLEGQRRLDEQSLMQQVATNAADAQKALTELAKNQQAVAQSFESVLERQNKLFLDRLEQLFLKDQLTAKKSELAQLSSQERADRIRLEQRRTLERGGVTSFSQVEGYRKDQDELKKYAELLQAQRRNAALAQGATTKLINVDTSDPSSIAASPKFLQFYNTNDFFRTEYGLTTEQLGAFNQSLSENKIVDAAARGRILERFRDKRVQNKVSPNLGRFADQLPPETLARNINDLNRLFLESIQEEYLGERAGTVSGTTNSALRSAENKLRGRYDVSKLRDAFSSDDRTGQFFGALGAFAGRAQFEGLDKSIETTTARMRELSAAISEITARLPRQAPGQATGGAVRYLAGGGVSFRPRGTDTVPAVLPAGSFVVNRDSARANGDLLAGMSPETVVPVMLTPGEAVVGPREAARNRALLEAINGARGPLYRAGGGQVDPDVLRRQERRRQQAVRLGVDPNDLFGRVPGPEEVVGQDVRRRQEERRRQAERLGLDPDDPFLPERQRFVDPPQVQLMRMVRPADVDAAEPGRRFQAQDEAARRLDRVDVRRPDPFADLRARLDVLAQDFERNPDAFADAHEAGEVDGLPADLLAGVIEQRRADREREARRRQDAELARQAALNPGGRSAGVLARRAAEAAVASRAAAVERATRGRRLRLEERLAAVGGREAFRRMGGAGEDPAFARQDRALRQRLAGLDRLRPPADAAERLLEARRVSVNARALAVRQRTLATPPQLPGAQAAVFAQALERQQLQAELAGRADFGLTRFRQAQRPLGFARGGLVPQAPRYMALGGGLDDQLIAARSGEYVVRKEAVSRLGVAAMNEVNQGRVPGGGGQPGISPEVARAFSRFSEGATALGRAMDGFLAPASALARALTGFERGAERLADALSAFPSSLKVDATQRVEVVFNGAEVLTRILPQVRELVEDAVKERLSETLKKYLPPESGFVGAD